MRFLRRTHLVSVLIFLVLVGIHLWIKRRISVDQHTTDEPGHSSRNSFDQHTTDDPSHSSRSPEVHHPAEHPSRSFAEVVHEFFPRWDLDHDGKVDGADILRQVTDPDVKGEEAAAVSAIHQLQRFTSQPLPPSTAEDIIHYEPGPHVPSLAHEYAVNWNLIRRAHRGVYVHGAPSLEDFHQGHEGDCYFLAVLGAAVERDPVAVRQMLSPRSGTGPKG